MTNRKYLLGLISRYYSIWRSNNATYEDWAKKRGLSFNSVMVLYSLIDEGKAFTQKEIALKWTIPKQTVNMVLKDFEKQGYVTFTMCPTDRRNKLIHLTPSGLSFASKIISELHELEISVLSDFGAERLAQMADDLEQFTILFVNNQKSEKQKE